MLQHRFEILTPFPSNQTKWSWSKEYQKAIDTIKKLVCRETLLSYPNFNKPLEIHTDASKIKLGSVKKTNPLCSAAGNSTLLRSIIPQSS